METTGSVQLVTMRFQKLLALEPCDSESLILVNKD